MVNENNPRILLDRYLAQIEHLRPLMYRYINLLENIESTTSFLVSSTIRHDERMRTERGRNRPEESRTSSSLRNPVAPRLERISDNTFLNLINNIRNSTRNLSRSGTHTTDISFNIDSLSPVPVIPTQRQINNATEIINFENLSDSLNRTCPITQQPFTENDRIVQIIPCGHCFNNSALMRWFRTSVHCPVCRADIRDYDPITTIRNPHTNVNTNITNPTSHSQNRVNEGLNPERRNGNGNGNENRESVEAIFTFTNLLPPSTFTDSNSSQVRNRQNSQSDNDIDENTTLV